MLNRIQLISFAAVGALVAFTIPSASATAADFVPQNLGPVGPNEVILTTVGSVRVMAYFLPENGHCGLNTVVWDPKHPDTGNPDTGMLAQGGRVSLAAGQIFHIHSGEKSLNLQCSDSAETLSIVGNAGHN